MGNVLGADVAAQQRLAGLMFDTARLFARREHLLTVRLGEVPWHGPYATRFRAQWAGSLRQRLEALAQMLDEAGRTLAEHARAQQEISTGTKVAGVAMAAGALGLVLAARKGDGPPAPPPPMVRNDNPNIVFAARRDAGPDGAGALMAPGLADRVDDLAARVQRVWPGRKLLITEATDEHTGQTALDIAVDDQDRAKLSQLYRLARDAGFDRVYFDRSARLHITPPAEQ
jgi:hypothetical protein